jgi:hypothetical protein
MSDGTTHMVIDLTNDCGDEEWLNVSDGFLADHPWATRSLMGCVYFYAGDPDDDGVCDEGFGIEVMDAIELVEAHGKTHVVRLWLDEAKRPSRWAHADGYLTGRAARAHLKRLASIPDEHCVSTLPD